MIFLWRDNTTNHVHNFRSEDQGEGKHEIIPSALGYTRRLLVGPYPVWSLAGGATDGDAFFIPGRPATARDTMP